MFAWFKKFWVEFNAPPEATVEFYPAINHFYAKIGSKYLTSTIYGGYLKMDSRGDAEYFKTKEEAWAAIDLYNKVGKGNKMVTLRRDDSPAEPAPSEVPPVLSTATHLSSMLRKALAELGPAAKGIEACIRDEVASLYTTIDTKQHMLNAYIKKVEELEPDAMRYRWLRECHMARSDRGAVSIVWPKYENGKLVCEDLYPSYDLLDHLIDERLDPFPPKQER